MTLASNSVYMFKWHGTTKTIWATLSALCSPIMHSFTVPAQPYYWNTNMDLNKAKTPPILRTQALFMGFWGTSPYVQGQQFWGECFPKVFKEHILIASNHMEVWLYLQEMQKGLSQQNPNHWSGLAGQLQTFLSFFVLLGTSGSKLSLK